MRLATHILSFFAHLIDSSTKKTRKSHHVQASPLCHIPNELLLLIVSHLSCADVACLALSCRQLLSNLERETPLLLPSSSTCKDSDDNSKDHKKQLLTRLSRDIPAYYLCHCCTRLHRWTNSLVPQNLTRCPSLDRSGNLSRSTYTHYRTCTNYVFRFTHLQLVMRRYRLGPAYGLSADSLSHLEVSRPEGDDETMTLLSVDARICSRQDENGEGRKSTLCLRIQQWVRLPFSCPSVSKAIDLLFQGRGCLLICSHMSPNEQNIYLHRLEAKNKISPASSCTPDITFRCSCCPVQFQIQRHELSGFGEDTVPARHHQALIITKWLDLGEGLDAEDPIWLAHTGEYRRRQVVLDPDNESIRRRFESEPGLTQQELTSQNMFLLEKERFQTELCLNSWEKWVLSKGQYLER